MNANGTTLAESRECEDCGGRGYDLGGLNPFEFEYCPNCLGSGIEPPLDEPDSIPWSIAASSAPRIQPAVASIGNGLYVRTGRSA